ncbi:DUF5134 domain-containing protein [Pseudonocardia sp. GCM10023141]|uniref:DUF5134 domain-containing protein n=1 Tax=Pseudonocardia sp. GCM10023141 TaxID=3252653 RepID=UPI00361E67B7
MLVALAGLGGLIYVGRARTGSAAKQNYNGYSRQRQIGVLLMQQGVTWIDVLLGVASLLAALYYIALLLGGRVRFTTAAAHMAMGVGMAAMFVPTMDPLPRGVWIAVFVVISVWVGVGCLRASTFLGEVGHHAVGAMAMLYMLFGHSDSAVGAIGVVEHQLAHHRSTAGAAPPLLMTAIALAFVGWFVADVIRVIFRPGEAAAPVRVAESVGAAPSRGAGPAVLAGLGRHIVMPDAVLSSAMAIMFLETV